MASETEYRDHVRGMWMGWLEGREPRGRGTRQGFGSGNGAPDLQLGIGVTVPLSPAHVRLTALVLPVELKVGRLRMVKGTQLLELSGIEEDQRKWHTKAFLKGVVTAFLVGVPEGGRWYHFVMRYGSGAVVRTLPEVAEMPGEAVEFNRAITAWAASQWGLVGAR